jgi:hypothetical protein
MLDKISAQAGKVINLAIESNLDGTITIRHGLTTGIGEINDSQAPVSQTDPSLW